MTPPGAGKVKPIHEIQVPISCRFLLGEKPGKSCSKSQNVQWLTQSLLPKQNQGINPKVDSGFKSVRPALKEVTQALGFFRPET